MSLTNSENDSIPETSVPKASADAATQPASASVAASGTAPETAPESDLKQFFRYVLPTMLFMFVCGLYNIMDGIFVGKATGETGLAACLLTFPLYCFVFGLGDMIGCGAAILIAKHRGEERLDLANRIFSGVFGMVLILCVGMLGLYAFWGTALLRLFGATPTLLPLSAKYFGIVLAGSFPMLLWLCLASIMRSDDQPTLSSGLMVVGAVGNIFLDYLFVMVFGWGVPGAAIATIVAEAITLALGLPYFFSKKCHLTFHFSEMFPTLPDALRVLKCGIPSLGAQSAIAIMLLCHNLQALKWGGQSALAAYAAISMIESLGSMLTQGVASGLQPLVSYYYGAMDFVRNRRFLKYGLLFSFLLGLLGLSFSLLACHTIPGFMGLTGEAASIATHGLLISAPAFLAMGLVKVGSHYYQATGRITASSVLIYGDCLILPLLLFLLPLAFHLDGVWMAMPVSRFLLLGILIIMGFLPCCRLPQAKE